MTCIRSDFAACTALSYVSAATLLRRRHTVAPTSERRDAWLVRGDTRAAAMLPARRLEIDANAELSSVQAIKSIRGRAWDAGGVINAPRGSKKAAPCGAKAGERSGGVIALRGPELKS
jgi:hypothetical protein